MQKFTVSRDDRYYQAFPDAVLFKDTLYCVFTRTTHHGDRTDSRIMLTKSADRGRSWSEPKVLLGESDHEVKSGFFNCARISVVNGGLAVITDRIFGLENEDKSENFVLFSKDGENWSEPKGTGCGGIVPDKLLEYRGKLFLSAHRKEGGWLRQFLWISENGGKTWGDRITLAAVDGLNLCEASILPLGDDLIAFMRENSFLGYDCKKAVSHDGGKTWGKVTDFPLPGCHRPVSGVLKSGNILITHRFLQGGNGWLGHWTQNFFAGLTDRDSVLAEERGKCATRIMPIDYDRSPVSDIGYSGWVQFNDGEIYIVYYLVDDAPKGQIRGCSLYERDFIIKQ
ncbi:MAG TPA: sialidase family protein [Oscillospiraceae bacterium]|nr:sialidase family protein [Oscillospiraceae bacterium]